MLKLENSIKIIVMQKDNEGNDLSQLNQVITLNLCKAFGGATLTDGKGYWIDNGSLYQDFNSTIECGYAGNLTAQQYNALQSAIDAEFNQAKQEAVTIYLNSDMYILDNADELEEAIKQSNVAVEQLTIN